MSDGKQIDVAALIESQKASWFRVGIVFMTCAIMLMEGYDIQVLAYAAPSIIKAWKINPAYFGPIFGFSLFGYMLGATVFSNFADRIGRKKIILSGILVFGLFNFATAYVNSLNPLLILRFIAGLGLGASIPSTIALTVEYFPARARATMIGVLFTGYTVGATVGSFIAAYIIPKFGWQSVFYIGGVVPMLLSAGLSFTLPESVRFLALARNQRQQVASILTKLSPDLVVEPSTQFVVREENRARPPGEAPLHGRPRADDRPALVLLRHQPAGPLLPDQLAAHAARRSRRIAQTLGNRRRFVAGGRRVRRVVVVLAAR